MPNFAVLDGKNILNIIVSESKSIAEEVTGKTCVEFTTENAEIGGTYENNKFFREKPYPSWILDETDNWIAPEEYPDIDKVYMWDESTVSWKEIV